jgi:hypothetical protein
MNPPPSPLPSSFLEEGRQTDTVSVDSAKASAQTVPGARPEKSATTIWYWRADYDNDATRFELKVWGRYDLTDKYDRESLVKEAAHDYHREHDGWEAAWPLEIGIAASEDGPELARFRVDRDVEPVFTARAMNGLFAMTGQNK